MTLREIDALVAERVMGWKPVDRLAMGWGDGPLIWSTGEDPEDENSSPTFQDFRPTESWDHAAEVMERMEDERHVVVLRSPWPWQKKWYAKMKPIDLDASYHAAANTAPLAICLAALRAKGVDVEVTCSVGQLNGEAVARIATSRQESRPPA